MKATAKRAIVTGSSRGLGFEIARTLLEEGMSVSVVARNQVDLDRTLKHLKPAAKDSEVMGFVADLSLSAGIEAYCRHVKDKWETVDVIVNNVGIYSEDSADQDISINLLRMIEVNLFAAVRITGSFLDVMKKRKAGHIINIVSIAAKNLRPEAASYSISKSALRAWTDVLRESLRSQGIRVTGLYPGPMNTSSWDGSAADTSKMIQTGDVTRVILQALRQSANSSMEEIVINTLSPY
jgi:short-subunit dehydrogenase